MYSDVSLLIDGGWRPALSGKTLPVLNPATGDAIGNVAHAEPADLDLALAAAQKGFDTWRKVPAFERYKVMRKAAENLRARADEVATQMTMEQGKPRGEAKMETLAVSTPWKPSSAMPWPKAPKLKPAAGESAIRVISLSRLCSATCRTARGS